MLKSKSFYVSVASVLCAIAVVGITSMAINSGGKNKPEEEKSYLEDDNNEDKNETVDISEEMPKTDSQEVIQNQTTTNQDINSQAKEPVKGKEAQANKKEDSKVDNKGKEDGKDKVSGNASKDKTEAVIAEKGLVFNEEKGLSWPVEGDILMNFSEDEMVYYKTLGQFMKSDKVLIEAAVGDKVKACAQGIITDVTDTRQTGKTVTMSIGSGYSVTYGELENVTVKKGDTVKSGQIIGTVSTPSGYYSKEGTNLYFKVMQNDVPVNPMYLLK